MEKNRKLILEDGSEYYGTGFGAKTDAVFELVFNTSVVGYQEIVSDPSYTDQGVVMSYPLIGNYGVADEDFESRMVSPSALIVRDLNDSPSNFRATRSISELLSDSGVPGISQVDTRKLVRAIRDGGLQRAILTDANTPVRNGVNKIKDTPIPHDAVKRCSCKKKWYSRTSNPKYDVVAIDCGMKSNIVRMLNDAKCNVTIVPYNTKSEDIMSLNPDGVFISNGPGDPSDVDEVMETVRAIKGKLPLFGICLGHQIIARAYGADTYKLKFGHRGGNHPIRDEETGKIFITSQNHSYAVDPATVKGTGLDISYINVLDDTVEGLHSDEDMMFCVQYHPESAPGPNDCRGLFEKFTRMMDENRKQTGEV